MTIAIAAKAKMGKYDYWVYMKDKKVGIERKKRNDDEDYHSGPEDDHHPYSPRGMAPPGSSSGSGRPGSGRRTSDPGPRRRSGGSGRGSQQMIGRGGGGAMGSMLPGLTPGGVFPGVGGSGRQQSPLATLQQQRASQIRASIAQAQQIQTMLAVQQQQQQQRMNGSIPYIPGMTVAAPVSALKFGIASSRKISKNSKNSR